MRNFLRLSIGLLCSLSSTRADTCREITRKFAEYAAIHDSQIPDFETRYPISTAKIFLRIEAKLGPQRTQVLVDLIEALANSEIIARPTTPEMRSIWVEHLAQFALKRIDTPQVPLPPMPYKSTPEFLQLRHFENMVSDFISPQHGAAGLLEKKGIEDFIPGIFLSSFQAREMMKSVRLAADRRISQINANNLKVQKPLLTPEQVKKVYRIYAEGSGTRALDDDPWTDILPESDVRQSVVVDHHGLYFDPHRPYSNSTSRLIDIVETKLDQEGPRALRQLLTEFQFLHTNNLGDGAIAVYVIQNLPKLADEYFAEKLWSIINRKAGLYKVGELSYTDAQLAAMREISDLHFDFGAKDLPEESLSRFMSKNIAPLFKSATEYTNRARLDSIHDQKLRLPPSRWSLFVSIISDHPPRRLAVLRDATRYEDFDVFEGKGFGVYSRGELKAMPPSTVLGQSWLATYGKVLKRFRNQIPTSDRFDDLNEEKQIELMSQIQSELQTLMTDSHTRQIVAAGFRSEVLRLSEMVQRQRLVTQSNLEKRILIFNASVMKTDRGPFESWVAPTVARKRMGLENQLSFQELPSDSAGHPRLQIVSVFESVEMAQTFLKKLETAEQAKALKLRISNEMGLPRSRNTLVFTFAPGSLLTREEIISLVDETFKIHPQQI